MNTTLHHNARRKEARDPVASWPTKRTPTVHAYIKTIECFMVVSGVTLQSTITYDDLAHRPSAYVIIGAWTSEFPLVDLDPQNAFCAGTGRL